MQRMKWEMEDQSLKFLDPIAYQEISDELDRQAKAHAAFMEHIQEEITTRLEKEGIKGTVYGRVKHVYSIYRKMYAQNKKLSEIFDLYAFRVIVDDIFTCYRVLGDIHDMFNARSWDGLRTISAPPKPNMYQSLHTTVIGSEGIPLRCRSAPGRCTTRPSTAWRPTGNTSRAWATRSWAPRRPSPGSAACWKTSRTPRPREYIRTLKVDLFADEVFVFTPQRRCDQPPRRGHPHRLRLCHPLRRGQLHDRGQGERADRGL